MVVSRLLLHGTNTPKPMRPARAILLATSIGLQTNKWKS